VLFDDLLVSQRLYDALDTESVRVLHEAAGSDSSERVSDHAPLAASFLLEAPGTGP
jgi:hypothetical protein